MKRFLSAFIAVLMFCATAKAQDGTWYGRIDVQGTPLTLVFNVSGEGGTLDVPDQGARGIKANISYNAIGGIEISVPSIGASYSGIRMGERMIGTFRQSGMEFALTLVPGRPVISRPQTPAGPFPYDTEDVSFSNGDAVLSGSLTLPRGWTPDTPVVLMVTGSGLQNRDEELFEHKPFAVIADALARGGVASLRYDDRGFGQSTGDAVNATTYDFRDDALSGVEFLRKRFSRVGVLGHSEGGTVALLLAEDRKADFVISLAGMAVSGRETLLAQNRRTLALTGLSEDIVARYCSALSDVFDAVVNGENPVVSGRGLDEALKNNLLAVASQCASPYMREFLSVDVSPHLGDIVCPVLALNGSLDVQVDCTRNLGVIAGGIDPSICRTVAFENHNHLLQRCKTGQVLEYGNIEETIDPAVLETIVGWIKGIF